MKKLKKKTPKSENLSNQAKLSKKYVWITVVVLVGVFLAMIFFVILPDVKRVYQKKDDFESQKLRMEIIKESAIKARDYSELIEGIRADSILLDRAVIEKESEVELIRAIEEISKSVGSTVKIEHYISPRKKVQPQLELSGATTDLEKLEEQQRQEEIEKQTVRLILNVEGNYKQFLEFYYKLENMSYVFNVDSIELKKPQSSVGLSSDDEKLPPDFVQGKVIISFIPK